MNRLMNEHGWYKNQFFGGGGMPDASTPQAPAPPPPPKPPPKKMDDDVENQKKEALDRKKFQNDREVCRPCDVYVGIARVSVDCDVLTTTFTFMCALFKDFECV